MAQNEQIVTTLTIDASGAIAQAQRFSEALDQTIQKISNAGNAADGAAQQIDNGAKATRRQSQALEELLRSTDPAYAAQQRLTNEMGRLSQASQALASQVGKAGVSQEYLKNATQALEQRQQMLLQTQNELTRGVITGQEAMQRLNTAQAAAAGGSGQFRGALSGLGYQLQDTIVQLQMGTNALVVLGQQGPQAASAFGPIGVAIGTAISVVSVLAMGIMSLKGNVEAAKTSFNDYGSAMDFAKRMSTELNAASGNLKASLEAEGRAAEWAAQKKLQKAEADLAALESALMSPSMPGAEGGMAGIAMLFGLQAEKAKTLRLEVLTLKAALGQYNDGARAVTSNTSTSTNTITQAKGAIEDYREALRQQLATLKLTVDNQDLSTAGTLRARLETEALAKAKAAGRIAIDDGTKALIDHVVAQQEAIDKMQEEEKAANKAATAGETLAKARAKQNQELDKQIVQQKALYDALGQDVSLTREANTQAKIAEELIKAKTTADTAEGKAIAEKVRQIEKYRALIDDSKHLKTAEQQLEVSKAELRLANESEPVRARALQAIRNQQEAMKLFGSTTSEAAREWLQMQDQIADNKSLVDYQKQVQSTAKDIARDWTETIYDALVLKDKGASIVDAFKALGKRIALALLETNIVLPITTAIVGSMPSLFGIQAPAGAASAAGGAGNSLAGNALSLGSKFIPNSWTSGITTAIDNFGASALGIGSSVIPGVGGQAATVAATTINPATGSLAAYNSWGAAGAQGATAGLTSYLGPIGAGFAAGGILGPMLANGNKAVGGLAGAASGAAAGAIIGSIIPGVGTLIGALLGGASGGLGGLIGTQKPTVGKTASADVTINAGGKTATYGNILTDNEGDPEVGKALGGYISSIFSVAAAGGGSLVKDFGFGQTAKDGYYIAGSVPYKSFGDDFAAMVRYALVEKGGLSGGGVNTLAAINNSKNKDAEEFAKDVALGAGIDAGKTALSQLDQSLNGVAAAAKKTTAESLAPMIAELERANKLGIGDAYKALASDQLKSYLDTLRNPPNYTEYETQMASLTGQFDAMREAMTQLNPAMVETVNQIQKETTARIQRQLSSEMDTALNSALGREYVNQINGLIKTQGINARNLAAAGLPTTRADEIFNANLTSLLRGLGSADLDVVNTLFGGDIGRLALTLKGEAKTIADNAAAAAQQARQESLLLQMRKDNASETINLLKTQQQTAQALKSTWEGVMKSVQTARLGNLTDEGTTTLDPFGRLTEALRQFRETLAQAKGGDAEAAGQLSTIQRTVLDAARDYYGSSSGYSTIFNEVQIGLSQVEDKARDQIRIANDSLNTLQSQLDVQNKILQELGSASNDDTATMISALNSGNASQIWQWAQRQSDSVQQQVLVAMDQKLGWQNNPYRYQAPSDVSDLDALGFTAEDGLSWLRQQGYNGGWDSNANAFIVSRDLQNAFTSYLRQWKASHSVPGYAEGGMHAGGWRIVGERGPELELTGPARYYNNSETRELLTGAAGATNDNGPMLDRLDRLAGLLERLVGVSARAGDSTIGRLDAMVDVLEDQASRSALAASRSA
jgi:hypothetical protein